MIETTDTLNTTDFENSYSEITSRKSLRQITGCKKPINIAPIFGLGGALIGRKRQKQKMKEYNDCLKRYNDEVANAKASAQEKTAELERAKRELEEIKQQYATQQEYKQGRADSSSDDNLGKGIDDGDGKILGMPKGLAIGLGIAVLAIGGFITYKIIKSKN